MTDSKVRPHITERTKAWRDRDIKPYFVEALDKIEEFGFQVMHVGSGEVSPNFSYTAGVFDTLGKPELITVGLASGVAHYALQYAVELMEDGVDLSMGKHRDVLGDVDVEFRKVDPKWFHQVMLRADWFYEGKDVPALQLIYPDLENRFQDQDDDFNEYFRQPILSGPIEDDTPAYDFWASHDEKSSLSRWKFPDSPHTGAYLSQAVHDKEEPITYVSHYIDGDWQFLGDTMSEGGGPVLSCLHHPIDDDPSLEEFHELPINWYATRNKPGDPWQRFEHPPEADSDAEPVDTPIPN